MRAHLLFACLLVVAVPAMADPTALNVTVKRVDVGSGQVFEVAASGLVKASLASAWTVLTNYEGLPQFVPDLEKTKVLSRTGNRVILEQSGVARFLFLSRRINLVVQAAEEPMSVIDITLVKGDMKVYACRWELTVLPNGGTRISYTGKLVPKFQVPGMLGANIIRGDIERMMKAVLTRLDRP